MSSADVKTVVLIGRTGSGKSTLANMLVKGDLNPPHAAEMGDGMRGTTVSCAKLEGRGWTVVDTVGFGEGVQGRVPDEQAREEVKSFLKEVQGEYSHIIFVLRKGRCDVVTNILWRTFLEIFKGSEKNFVVLVTEADKKYLEANLSDLKEIFKECEHFMYADFPPVDDEDDDDLKEEFQNNHKIERDRLEQELQAMFTFSVKPDICGMTNDEIEKKAETILKIIARLVMEAMAKYGPKILAAVVLFVNAASLASQFAA